jgi:pSer/pThr/pTyr-binding forkhead associated (FHA) protein
MSATLILKATAGDLHGQQFSFSAPTCCVLGRSRCCTLPLRGDATVSRQHCLVELDDDGIWVQDLDSRNGTFVNGQKIGQRQEGQSDGEKTTLRPPRRPLRDGDQLRVCANVFAVRVVDSAGAAQESSDSVELLDVCRDDPMVEVGPRAE